MKKAIRSLALIACVLVTAQFSAPKAHAIGLSSLAGIKAYIHMEFIAYRSWFISVFWEDNLLPAMQLLAGQTSTSAVQQTQMMGSFMDAQNVTERQQALNEAKTQAWTDYKPSTGMCQFGSSVKSLATSERRGEFNARVLAQRSLDRQLGRSGSAGAYGALDQASRWNEYKTRFCNKRSNNGGMASICTSDGSEADNDINYSRIDNKLTLDTNFSGNPGGPGRDEASIFALSNYLYANDSFTRIGAAALKPGPNGSVTNMQKDYLDMRGVVAKRGIAENSFNAITAMKSAGSPESSQFIGAVLKGLGVSPAEVTSTLGNNPSYYAQMEVLTKKIYQSPNFYTGLYESPANVRRKDVSMQAIGLMQKFDMLKSYQRTEASLSMLLELAVEKMQGSAENEINTRTKENAGNKTK